MFHLNERYQCACSLMWTWDTYNTDVWICVDDHFKDHDILFNDIIVSLAIPLVSDNRING